MKAFAILRHAILQVLGNAGQVARIAALPLALGLGVMVLVLPSLARGLGGPGTILALTIALGLIGTWVAVNFHRMVLLDERFGWLPPLHLREIGQYLLAMIPMVLVLTAIAVGVGLLAANLIGPSGLAPGASAARLIVEGAIGTLLGALALRFFAILPGAAIGAGIGGGSGFRGAFPTFLALSAILVAIQIGVGLGLALLGMTVARATGGVTPGLMLGFGLVNQALTVIVGLVGVSVLTTLYGHYVQGRPLREG